MGETNLYRIFSSLLATQWLRNGLSVYWAQRLHTASFPALHRFRGRCIRKPMLPCDWETHHLQRGHNCWWRCSAATDGAEDRAAPVA